MSIGALVMVLGGAVLGIQTVLGLVMWMFLLSFWAIEIVVFIEVFMAWFWINKTISIYLPLVGLGIVALAWVFGVDIARFLSENTKFLYPGNLHHAFELVSGGVPAIEWYVKIFTTISAAVPWLVEAKMLMGFRRQGERFREGDHYQRWCSPEQDEYPTFREALRDGWDSRDEPDSPTWRELWHLYKQLFRDIFQ